MKRINAIPRVLIYFFYRFLGILLSPLILLYVLYRGVKEPRYFKGLDERLGLPPLTVDGTVPGGIWLHAVSVGEVLTAVALLKRLKTAVPGRPLFVSVTTLAGRKLAEERLAGIADAVFYAPLDYVFAVRRVLRRLKPRLVVILETEIWPNLFRESKRFGCGLVVVNGRISDRAFPRYEGWKWFFGAVLQHADRVMVQNEIGRERYQALGVPGERIRVMGNLKYDFEPRELQAPEVVRALVEASRPDAVWIAASTMPPAEAGDPDEDDVVIAEFHKLAASWPGLLLMLVPRRPERFPSAADKLARAGVRWVRRSELGDGARLELPGVLLLDSVGELSSLFPLADVVFMGGTLARRGGHNILEPAFFSKPVVIGPHMENFPDIAEEFRREGAVCEIARGEGLADAVDGLLRDRASAEAFGRRGRELAEAKRGVTAAVVEQLLNAYRDAVPVEVPAAVTRAVLGPFSSMWRAGTALDQARKRSQAGRLRAKVISVGGISMGGAGKTPVTQWLAARLRERGLRVGILTRGYKRRSPERLVILPRGAECTVARTGDEAQILLRRGDAALGIGADRLEAGRELERAVELDVILLDDGFQHWRLERDLDIVVLDGFDPLAGGAVFPLGRQREPVENLSRASGFVVTRCPCGFRWDGLERRLHELRAGAPVFYCGVQPVEWVSADGAVGARELGLQRAAAFCGLGNPASFWGTLRELGIEVEPRWAFGDHHSYRPHQVKRMAEQARRAGVEALLTTEKDAVNLPEGYEAFLGGLKLYWLRMDVRMEGRLEDWVIQELGIREGEMRSAGG